MFDHMFGDVAVLIVYGYNKYLTLIPMLLAEIWALVH
jgi:hypothetical protein